MSDVYNSDDADFSGALDDSGGDPITPDVMPGALSVAAPSPPADSPIAALKAATARLKAQRNGLSPRQQIAALLIGFGQPTAHAGWQSGVSNAARTLMEQQLAARKADQQRQELIAKYDLMGAHYQAQNQSAELRAKAAVDAAKARADAAAAKAQVPDNEARFRLGMAKQYFPELPEAEIVKRNLMYDPKVNAAALAWKAATPMAASGDVLPAPAPPTLGDFLAKARLANPGVSDAELRAYYIKKYGGQ